jgi:hypothetical protein
MSFVAASAGGYNDLRQSELSAQGVVQSLLAVLILKFEKLE